MPAIRYISAGVAAMLSVAVASASATDFSNPSAAEAGEAANNSAGPTRKVRVINMSSENAVKSDQTKWYNRVVKPPVQKNAAKAEIAKAEVRAEKPKKKAVRRAAPRQEAYSAYASEQTRERRGFGLFDW
jgi:hypothetical protein